MLLWGCNPSFIATDDGVLLIDTPQQPIHAVRWRVQITVEAQLPGLKPQDLDINVEQGVLRISSQTTHAEERNERNYLVREHRNGRFSRSMRLPATCDADACTANSEHGRLTLTFPKSEAAKPRRIAIGGASQPATTSGNEKTGTARK